MDPPTLHANARAVVDAAAGLGLAVEVREFPEGTRTAEDAARAVGVDVGQIVKSLVFAVGDEVVVALVSGPNRLDERRLAEAAGDGSAPVTRPDAAGVRAATGYPIGGVPPFGHPRRLATFVDEDLLGYDELWAAAGTPRHVFPIAPADLVRATGGRVAPLRVAAR
ncbi:MAG TPA: YbaK/EbsC family protein [Acidimicrobiales bacterium]|jgi:prolyl-tRNA editing enzyme YbaK/EbsC (Cys-tRNA(Pro) deacylase)|nr:YbaK/EbsC family protein [Acidimicrobiales bacterium]